jgi:hypothetical protein
LIKADDDGENMGDGGVGAIGAKGFGAQQKNMFVLGS